MTAILSARELRLSLGGHEILHGIDLDFEPHRIHAILGPNGCGKTTLIKALCGAAKLSHGEVRLDDQPIRKLSASKLARKMAVVWQGGHTTGDLTVQRLVSYGRYAQLPWWQLRPSSHDDAVERAMTATGVLQMADRRVETLSGGERQRVWVAAALAQEPKLLLLDEPTTYLDIAHQIDILELVRELNQTMGLTVIAVLHDLTQAARYCDRCVVMGDGRILRQGTPGQALSWSAVAQDFAVDSWVTSDPDGKRPVIAPRQRIQARSATTPTHQPDNSTTRRNP